MEIIRAEGVSKEFRLGRNTISALRSVSMGVEAGEFLAIVGPSGSGKSTLLNLMGCIERPTSGRILVDGNDITALPADRLAEIRASRLGFVFQTFNLLPVLTVAENVEYPLHLARIASAEKRGRVEKALEEVGLGRFSGHKPSELSGGQRQRVAVARALVACPAVVLADEPTANLDQRTGEEIIRLMKDLNARLGTTFIFSTHDPKIMKIAGRIVELRDGEIAGADAP